MSSEAIGVLEVTLPKDNFGTCNHYGKAYAEKAERFSLPRQTEMEAE